MLKTSMLWNIIKVTAVAKNHKHKLDETKDEISHLIK